MKIWIILIIVGLLVVGGFALAGSVNSEPVKKELPSCNGACAVGQSCGNVDCATRVGKSCNCGNR